MVRKRKTKVIESSAAQLSLCFFLTEEADPTSTPAPLDQLVASWLSAMLDDMDRDKVAAAVSDRIGRRVTRTQLDQWVAPSQKDRHTPADAFVAIMLVTGRIDPLEGAAALMGRKVVTQEEAVCAEFGALALVQQQAASRQKLIRAQMDDVLAGQLLGRMKQAAVK